MAEEFERYTNPKKVTIELTIGQAEAILEALQTTDEVLRQERQQTGDPFSDHDRRLLRAIRSAGSKVEQGL